jgi:cell shape-determining protein MreC
MRLQGKITKRGVLIGLLVVSAAMALGGRRLADPLRGLTHFAMAPLGHPLTYLAGEARQRVANVGVQSLSPSEVRQLQDENQALAAQVERLAGELRDSYDRLATVQGLSRKLYGAAMDFPCELIPSRVVGAGTVPYSRSRVITGASADVPAGAGVTTRNLLTDRTKSLPAGLAVINAEALVGRVSESGQYTAVVQLVTDARFELWGRVWRNPNIRREIIVGAQRQPLGDRNNKPVDVHVRGTGGDSMVARQVALAHNIQAGDWLMTRGDDAFLPADVLVGTVADVTKDLQNPGMVTLHVRPAAAVENLQDLYIVVPPAFKPAVERRKGD